MTSIAPGAMVTVKQTGAMFWVIRAVQSPRTCEGE